MTAYHTTQMDAAHRYDKLVHGYKRTLRRLEKDGTFIDEAYSKVEPEMWRAIRNDCTGCNFEIRAIFNDELLTFVDPDKRYDL